MDFDGKIDVLRGSIRELRDASARQYERAQVLLKATQDLLATAQNHENGTTGLERAS